MPGSHCVDSTLGSFCHRRCQADTDCPCQPTDPLSCRDGLCYLCASLGQSCDPERKCCDAGTACSSASGGICCSTEVGHACSSPAECCNAGGLTCWSTSGTCQPCLEPGKAGCFEDTDCCGKAQCRDGVCAVPCDLGAACDTGLPGVCGKGHVDKCDPVTGPHCLSDQEASQEMCDGLDNDCNGKVDDNPGLGDACQASDIPNCESGFVASGVWACINGQPGCDATHRFCGTVQGSIGCGGTMVDGDYCGQCSGQPCGLGQLCTPNELCAGQPNNVICKDPDNICPSCSEPPCVDLKCWLPSDVGSCGAP